MFSKGAVKVTGTQHNPQQEEQRREESQHLQENEPWKERTGCFSQPLSLNISFPGEN